MAQLAVLAMAGGQMYAGEVAAAEGKAAENVEKYNAIVKEREAAARRQKARFDQQRQAKKGERIKSKLIAKTAAAGGGMSPATSELLAEQAAELELENLLIGYEGEVEAQQAEAQARLHRYQGKLLKKKGKRARKAAYIGAGATSLFLTGFGGRVVLLPALPPQRRKQDGRRGD